MSLETEEAGPKGAPPAGTQEADLRPHFSYLLQTTGTASGWQNRLPLPGGQGGARPCQNQSPGDPGGFQVV